MNIVPESVRKILHEYSVTLSKSEKEVRLQCDRPEDALVLFEWLESLGNTEQELAQTDLQAAIEEIRNAGGDAWDEIEDVDKDIPEKFPLLCRLGIHRWGKWKDLERIDFLMPQIARCPRCNRAKTRCCY